MWYLSVMKDGLTAAKENKAMSAEVNELRISAARLKSESKDATITLDSWKDRVIELQRDIDEQKTLIDQLKTAQSREKEEEKEKRKQEMLSDMLSKIGMVRGVCETIGKAEKVIGRLFT